MTEKIIDRSGWNYTIVPNEIIETTDLDIYQKMFYITLKKFANIQTSEAFPGVKKAALYSGMSERKARQVIAELEDKKLIHVDRRKNETSLYTILKIPKLSFSDEDVVHDMQEGGARHAGGVVHDMQEGGAPGADELKKLELKKLELKKENNKDNVANAPSLPYQEIVSYLNEKTGDRVSNYRASGKKTQSLIRARMKEGFTVDDFKTVIDKRCQRWLDDRKMVEYLRPETLFGTRFESYLNAPWQGGNVNAIIKPSDRLASEYDFNKFDTM